MKTGDKNSITVFVQHPSDKVTVWQICSVWQSSHFVEHQQIVYYDLVYVYNMLYLCP